MSKPNMRKAAAAIADVDAAVKRRRRDEKDTAPVVVEPLIVANARIRDWIKQLRELIETNKKDAHTDYEHLLIRLNEDVKQYSGASADEDILIPDDYVPFLFGYSGIDQLAKLFFNLDGQYYHDCSIRNPKPVGKYILVTRGDIDCSHLRFNQFGRRGEWGPIVGYEFRQLSEARRVARGKALIEAAIEFEIDGLTPDIVAIVQSFFPTIPESKQTKSVDAGIHGMVRVPDPMPLPDVADEFFANGNPKARRARIPWCWNHNSILIAGTTHEYPATPDTPASPSYSPTSPSDAPTSPSYSAERPSSPSDRDRVAVVEGWESNTLDAVPQSNSMNDAD